MTYMRNSKFTPPILVHCHLRWDVVWQRPQHIFSRLARHHPILFLEDPMDGDGLPRLQVTTPQPNIVRVVPVLPGCAANMPVDEQGLATLELLERARLECPLLQGRFENPIQWFYSPMPAKVFMGKFDAITVVYDCMDALADFRLAPSDLSQREEALLAHADIVFADGYELFKAQSQGHGNAHFFGCGVDAVLLAQEVESAVGASWDATVAAMRALVLECADSALRGLASARISASVKQMLERTQRDWQAADTTAAKALRGRP